MAQFKSLIIFNLKFVLLLKFALLAQGDYTSSEFRAFYFIQQWLPSYCNQEGTPCCYPPSGKPTANFTIYGLWPYDDNGGSLENCPGASFNVAPLKSMENLLEQEWPSFTCPQIGRKFWLHEWNKHGTCSKSLFLDEVTYFETALNLKNKIDILQTLAKGNIQPDNQLYTLQSIKSIISRSTGFQPLIFCNRDSEENSQIWQVLLCVDKNTMELINCSNVPDGRRECDSSIKFPSF